MVVTIEGFHCIAYLLVRKTYFGFIDQQIVGSEDYKLCKSELRQPNFNSKL